MGGGGLTGSDANQRTGEVRPGQDRTREIKQEQDRLGQDKRG